MRRSIYKILFLTALIAFLILVVPSVLFTPADVESKMSVDTEKVVNNYYCRNDSEGIMLWYYLEVTKNILEFSSSISLSIELTLCILG